MPSVKIKNKYRNITIPYFYANYNQNISGYIYKDEFYSKNNLDSLFNDFIGFYLDYHFEVDGVISTVHSLEEVAEGLLNNYNSFKIPSQYKEDFSDSEYKAFIKAQEFLKENKQLVIEKNAITNNFKNKNSPWNKLIKEIKGYNNTRPIKVYSSVFKRYFYVANSYPYWSLLSTFEEIYGVGFYYQYNGDGIDEYSDHQHAHDFEYVIREALERPHDFKIYKFQEQFFSKQEIKLLNAITKKLKSTPYESNISYYNDILYNGELAHKYYEYRDKKRYFKAYLCNKKIKRIIKANQKKRLENHKITY